MIGGRIQTSSIASVGLNSIDSIMSLPSIAPDALKYNVQDVGSAPLVWSNVEGDENIEPGANGSGGVLGMAGPLVLTVVAAVIIWNVSR